MFEFLKRKKKRESGLPKREYPDDKQLDFQEKILQKAEEKAEERVQRVVKEELLEVQKYNANVRNLRFVKTHHTVLKALYKIPTGGKIFKEIVTIGYVQGVAIAPNDLIVISYTPRAPTWLDEVFMSLSRVLGRHPQSRLLWAFPQFCPLPAMDHTIIVETSRIMNTPWGEFALPPMMSEDEVSTFYAIYKKAQTLEGFIDVLLKRSGQLVDTALTINPFIKSYNLIEKTKNQKKKEERFKIAEGGEIILTKGDKDIWEEFNI